jgi:hypothetical protein
LPRAQFATSASRPQPRHRALLVEATTAAAIMKKRPALNQGRPSEAHTTAHATSAEV